MHISNLTPKVQRPGRKAAATFNCIWLTWTTKGQFLFRLSVPCCRFANGEGSLVLSWETELDICIFPDTKNFPSNWKWIKEWSRCQHLVQNRFECNFRSESLYLYHTADFAAIQHQSWKRCRSNFLPMQMQMQYEVQVKFCTASHQSQSVGGAVQRRSEINPMIQPGPKSPTTCPKLYASPTFWHNFHCSVMVTFLVTVSSLQAGMDIFIWGMIIIILCWVLKARKTKISPPIFITQIVRDSQTFR